MKKPWLIAVILLAGVFSCDDNDDDGDDQLSGLPVATTTTASTITQYTAHSGGTVSTDGGTAVTARGVCWSNSHDPTTGDSKTTNGTGTGSFASILTGLAPNTTYYLRAYAVNSKGTVYGNELSFATLLESETTVTDIDGNEYAVVIIGTQTWMKENLRTSRYRNGEEITTGLTNALWNTTTGAFAVYDNDADNNEVYGKLYNWYAAADSRQVAPEGWHVPSEDEWSTLIAFLGGFETAGGTMKEAGLAHWKDPNTGADNNSGFTGLPSGFRDQNGAYGFMSQSSHWWTNDEEFSGVGAQATALFYNQAEAIQVTGDKRFGAAIRCVKD